MEGVSNENSDGSTDIEKIIQLILEQKDATGDLSELIKQFLKQEPIKKRKIALLPFHSRTLAESATFSLSTLFYNHFFKDNFEFISPKEVESILTTIASENLGCYSFECSVKIGREIAVDYVIEGEINSTNKERYDFTVKVIQVEDGAIIFQEKIKINIKQAEEQFFKTAQRALEYIPILGVIERINGDSYIISLGQNDGVKVGDKLLVLQLLNQYDITNRLNDSVDNIIAILTINDVAQGASSGLIEHRFRQPEINDRVVLYSNKIVQLKQISLARRQIDNLYRNIKVVQKTEEESKEKLEQLIDEEIKRSDKINEERFQKLKQQQERLLLRAVQSYEMVRNLKYAMYVSTGLLAYNYWIAGYDPTATSVRHVGIVTSLIATWYYLSNIEHEALMNTMRKRKFIVTAPQNLFDHDQYRFNSSLQKQGIQKMDLYQFSYQF